MDFPSVLIFYSTSMILQEICSWLRHSILFNVMIPNNLHIFVFLYSDPLPVVEN